MRERVDGRVADHHSVYPGGYADGEDEGEERGVEEGPPQAGREGDGLRGEGGEGGVEVALGCSGRGEGDGVVGQVDAGEEEGDDSHPERQTKEEGHLTVIAYEEGEEEIGQSDTKAIADTGEGSGQ